jgi:hypothetical protein
MEPKCSGVNELLFAVIAVSTRVTSGTDGTATMSNVGVVDLNTVLELLREVVSILIKAVNNFEKC